MSVSGVWGCCDAVVGGGSKVCRIWLDSLSLLKSSSSASSHSFSNVGRSGIHNYRVGAIYLHLGLPAYLLAYLFNVLQYLRFSRLYSFNVYRNKWAWNNYESLSILWMQTVVSRLMFQRVDRLALCPRPTIDLLQLFFIRISHTTSLHFVLSNLTRSLYQ